MENIQLARIALCIATALQANAAMAAESAEKDFRAVF